MTAIAMSEAVLIEIAQRFRKLEDAIEAADILHAERIERAQERIIKANADYSAGLITYQVSCVRGGLATKDRDDAQELRTSIEKTLDACRDDMTEMQEAIRRGNQ